jgi:predicted DNA-binding antitoxin AbrB/MazE fold protein
MQRVIRAVYENGVLRPLQRVRMRERKVCLLSVYPEEEWRHDFEALLRRTHKRANRHAAADIEADITAARAEAKTKRRESRRSA